jgi:hypothetical protein
VYCEAGIDIDGLGVINVTWLRKLTLLSLSIQFTAPGGLQPSRTGMT